MHTDTRRCTLQSIFARIGCCIVVTSADNCMIAIFFYSESHTNQRSTQLLFAFLRVCFFVFFQHVLRHGGTHAKNIKKPPDPAPSNCPPNAPFFTAFEYKSSISLLDTTSEILLFSCQFS